MPRKEVTKAANKDEPVKALKQRGWTFLDSREAVNRDDVRELNSHVGSLVSKGKKLGVAIIERD